MNQFRPSADQIAQILLGQGIQPGPDQNSEDYFNRVDEFMANNQHLRNSDYDHYIKNKDQIHQSIKAKIKLKYALVSVGHVAKWAKTTHSALTVAASKLGSEALKKGWGSLVNTTAQISAKQLTKTTLLRTLSSSTTWIVAGVVCAIEIGIDFYRLCKGQIQIKQFFINSGKYLMTGAASVTGGAGGAALGAFIGSFIGPIGAVIGIAVGGIIGGVSASLLTNYTLDKIEQACVTFNNPKKIFLKALQFFELPENYTPLQLEAARKAKYSLYHPDIWKDASLETQQEKSKKLMEMLQYYEIIENYKK